MKTPKKVLLIDDDESVIVFFKRSFEQLLVHGTLTATSSPISGLESIKKEDFDLVFLDLKMGAMSGEEVFQRIRKTDAAKVRFTPVVIFSGFIDHATAPRLLKHGFASFVFKPEDFSKEFFTCLFRTHGLIE